MTKIVALRLETCHANPDGVAWYAYVEGDEPPSFDAGELRRLANEDTGPLGIETFGETGDKPEEVGVDEAITRPGLRRFWVGSAC